MSDLSDSKQDSNVSIIAVLPDNERKIFSLSPQITVSDFINILNNNTNLSNFSHENPSLIHGGKILNNEEKFSSISNSSQILVYVIFQNSSFENTYLNETSQNNNNQQVNFTFNDLIDTDNFHDYPHFALLPRFFNYPYFPFVFREHMEDETPILNNEEVHGTQQDTRFNHFANLIINVVYFIIGFSLDYKSIYLILFLCLFGLPRLSIVFFILEGLLARVIYNFATHYISKKL